LRPLFFLLALLLALPACAGDPPIGTLTATQLPLASEIAPGGAVDNLVFRGALQLTSDDPRFGGLSGLHVSAGGRATAVSDRGFFVEFDIVEAADGTLTGADRLKIEAITDSTGRVFQRQRDRDSEEIVMLPDGTRIVAFEHNPRLLWFAPGSNRTLRVLPLAGLVQSNNNGVEAVAALADGRLWLIAERLGEQEGVRRGWIVGGNGRWARLDYKPVENDDVSAAAVLPNGDVLVLERWASVLAGFQNRLVRIPAAALAGVGGPLAGEELLRLRPPRLSENFEGVAVREQGGRLAVYLVSDDNYFALQRTLLLKFELPN
jgi:hypothetical protein